MKTENYFYFFLRKAIFFPLLNPFPSAFLVFFSPFSSAFFVYQNATPPSKNKTFQTFKNKSEKYDLFRNVRIGKIKYRACCTQIVNKSIFDTAPEM